MVEEKKTMLSQDSTKLDHSTNEEVDYSILQAAIDEFESSIGYSLTDYASSKEAQKNAQKKLNESRRESDGQPREEL